MALDSELELLRDVADELPVAIWLGKVPGGEVLYVNKTFRQILGMDPPEGAAAGRYAEPYGVHTLTGEVYPEDQMPYERVLRARATVVVDDLVIHRRDGEKVHLRVFARPLFGPDGEITHVLEAFTDITREVHAERARAEGEARLRQAQRMESVGNLAGGIAHDFNNLLGVVKIVASQLRVGERDPRRLEALDQIDQVTATAVRLTQGLLGFARRGRQLVQPLSANAVVAAIAELCRRTIGARIEVRTELAAARDVVRGDASQLEQVVMNLALNARDAMPEGGALVFRTREAEVCAPRASLGPGRYVVLEVADTGTGIDPELRDRVFEPYFTTKTAGPVKGTGLGLATVYGIAQSHGGTVEIDDNAPRGTVVRVFLPATDAPIGGAAAPTASPPPAPAPRGPVRGAGQLVLVVDDEPLVRAAAGAALEQLGYRVLVAHDGARAVELYKLHRHEVGVVLLDVVMPGMDGRDTFLALRALDPGVRVVLTTGYTEDERAQSLLELGVRAFLRKPFDLAALSQALGRARAM